MTRAPGSGSRARSREIGYGDAMMEMHDVLAGMRRGLEAAAQADDTAPLARLELLAMARAYRRAEKYAFATWEVAAGYRDGRFARIAEWRDFAERQGYVSAGPRELPQRGQSEHN